MFMNAKGVFYFVLVLGIAVLAFVFVKPGRPAVRNFFECEEADYPVQESFPRRCTDKTGKVFVEDVGNVLEKQNLIRLDRPRPNEFIESPLEISGSARGVWFFEASFPVTLKDSVGRIIAEAPAEAQGEWMTAEFAPFKAVLTFSSPTGEFGSLILEKDNPSGLPEHADYLRVPVRFK